MEINLKRAVSKAVDTVEQQVKSRGFRAARELRNSALYVLRGKRSGRVYKKRNSSAHYTASAPGEPPAVDSDTLRASWRPLVDSEKTASGITIKPAIHTDVKYAPWLQDGNKRIKPRPYKEPIIEQARPKVDAIFKEPYLKQEGIQCL